MTNKDWALFYLEKYNWSVIPVDETKKPDKYLPTWIEYQKRLPTKLEIEEWWSKYPNANVAVLCGKTSNLTVFDFDIDEDGNVDAELVSQMPETLSAISPSNGFHLFYTYNPELKSSNNSWGELQNDGKYILIAPSYGKYYKKILKREVEGNWRWHNKTKPTFLNTKTYITLFGELKKELIQSGSLLNTLPTTNRNNWFYKEACALFSKNIRKEQVLFLLKQVYQNIEDKKDFTWDEATKTILSASKYEQTPIQEIDMTSYSGTDKIITSHDVFEQIKSKKFEFLDTGFPRLNSEEMTDGGFLENDFIVLSGEAKSGKTELCLQLVEQMEKYNPLFLALEDSVADQMARKLRKYGQTNTKKYYTYAHTPSDGASFEWVQLKIKESIQKNNTKVVFIDNLEWFENEKTGYKNQKEVFKKLKNICDEFKVCIILVVHIKGDSQFAYGTKRPDIQRLKGGSHIYQMATKVLMVWRVKKGKGEERFDAGYTRVILGVDRFSGNNDKDFQLKYERGRFVELTEEEYENLKGKEPETKSKINIKQFKTNSNYKDDII